MFWGVFFDKISFPGQTVNFGLYHVLHILKAIVAAENLSYLKTLFEHPTRRQIFAITVGRICQLNLTLRFLLQGNVAGRALFLPLC